MLRSVICFSPIVTSILWTIFSTSLLSVFLLPYLILCFFFYFFLFLNVFLLFQSFSIGTIIITLGHFHFFTYLLKSFPLITTSIPNPCIPYPPVILLPSTPRLFLYLISFLYLYLIFISLFSSLKLKSVSPCSPKLPPFTAVNPFPPIITQRFNHLIITTPVTYFSILQILKLLLRLKLMVACRQSTLQAADSFASSNGIPSMNLSNMYLLTCYLYKQLTITKVFVQYLLTPNTACFATPASPVGHLDGLEHWTREEIKGESLE